MLTSVNFQIYYRSRNLFPRAFQKCIMCQFPSTELKVMTSYLSSIVTVFQIWACHVTCAVKLSKVVMSSDTLLNFRKVTKYELDTCTGSRVINFFVGGITPGWNRVKNSLNYLEIIILLLCRIVV